MNNKSALLGQVVRESNVLQKCAEFILDLSKCSIADEDNEEESDEMTFLKEQVISARSIVVEMKANNMLKPK